LAASPKALTENPPAPEADGRAAADALSHVLGSIRLSGSVQFCFMPTGEWETEGKRGLKSLADDPSSAIPFHILVQGSCWLRIEGEYVALAEGDVVAFPFGTTHALGAGGGGRKIAPVEDLPPKPWREVPVLRYGEAGPGVRLLCGYLQCDAMRFCPLRDALPRVLHVRTAKAQDAGWLRATIAQIVAEVDRPRTGGVSMLERLTEITFIELLRHQIIAAKPGAVGWLAALADPALGRCLGLIHDDPKREWSVPELSAASGLSRSALTERFETVLATSPMRYVREWRLCLASVALGTTGAAIAAVAHEAGYGTEAAFNRAFSRAYGMPPAAWRQNARRGVS
jgi:AraC-like DNA-binding protein